MTTTPRQHPSSGHQQWLLESKNERDTKIVGKNILLKDRLYHCGRYAASSFRTRVRRRRTFAAAGVPTQIELRKSLGRSENLLLI